MCLSDTPVTQWFEHLCPLGRASAMEREAAKQENCDNVLLLLRQTVPDLF